MSEKPGFTKGPWKQINGGFHISAKGQPGKIASAHEIHMDKATRLANATLIAAAPDLHEQGRKAERLMEQAADFLGNHGFIDMADELRIQRQELAVALAKAEGRS